MATAANPPGTSTSPAPDRPSSTRLTPSSSGRPSSSGSALARTVRSAPATTTSVDPDVLRLSSAAVRTYSIRPSSTAVRVALPLASVSAISSARRPSTSSARCVDCATVTAATPTRTTQTMTTCSASSWPASDSRRDTGTPDWSGTRHAIGPGPGPSAQHDAVHTTTTTSDAHASVTCATRVATVPASGGRPPDTQEEPMRNASLRRLTAGTVAAGLLLTGCGTTAEGGAASGGSTEGPVTGLRVLVPNSPGSGYDTTARAWAQVAEEEGLAEQIEVFNLEGAGGTVGLQRLVNETGNADLLMQMGLGVVGAQYSNQSEATLEQTTPIARLIEEAEAIVVPASSPYQSLDQLVQAWSADPGNTPVGGASNPGGPDHLTPMLLAQEVGVEPAEVNYVAYDGGGELLAGILGGDVAFAATGIGEVTEPAASGDV